jgi:hypothetical protein
MTTKPFTQWDFATRPPFKIGVGVNDSYCINDPHLQADLRAQHDRLHEHQIASGLTFPDRLSDDAKRHPLKYWCGSSSPVVTKYWIAHHNGEDTSNNKWSDHEIQLSHAVDEHLNNGVPTPEKVHVYSGISGTFNEHLQKLKPGTLFENPAPIATSLSPGLAIRKGAHTISITLPEGVKGGVYVGKFGGFEGELEYTLKRKAPLLYKGMESFRPYHDYPGISMNVHHFKFLRDPTF